MREKKLSPGAVRGLSRIKALISVYFIAAVDNCGYAIAFALFPPLLLDAKYGFLSGDASFTHKLMAIGALYAAFPIAQLIGAPILGEMADSYGRKRIFLLSIFGTMLGYFLTGATISMKSITLLCVSRLVTGLFSGNLGLCNAAIADLSPDEKTRAKNYGILTVIWE